MGIRDVVKNASISATIAMWICGGLVGVLWYIGSGNIWEAAALGILTVLCQNR